MVLLWSRAHITHTMKALEFRGLGIGIWILGVDHSSKGEQNGKHNGKHMEFGAT